ncbi:glycine zipper domain-containing protein [Desulfopila sp. IMCC35008]|uniref:glycine zipper domain-containing protein n=1 Tax=Desulfopila sp. IMCC35008 TaxID=2653858 RepID=UPI0013D56D77|nr:glycine zipper domain-containing protein [Desulfopila sp. IMCC35008]
MLKLKGLLIIGIIYHAGLVMAADLVVYPANNQPAEQQTKDQDECRQWASGQSGYDPNSAPVAEAAPQPNQTRARDSSIVKGAVAGAAVGGLGGSMGGKFGKGAATGAAAGMALGAVKEHRENQQGSQAAQADSQSAALEANFKKAFATCLEGRGYTVK